MQYPEPTRPGLYLADGPERTWITDDTSEPAWTTAIATVRVMIAANKLPIFSRPKIMHINAAGHVTKETRDLSLSE